MDQQESELIYTTRKHHKFFTTVTPFSKTLALIIFTTFPILGFYLGYKLKPDCVLCTNTNVVIPKKDYLIMKHLDKKIFISTKYGFSFEFPDNWEISIPSQTEKEKYGSVVEVSDPDQSRASDGYWYSFVVSHFSDINNDYAKAGSWMGDWHYQNLEDFFTDERSPIQKVGITKVDGKKAYEVTIGGNGMEYGVFIETTSGLYELTFPRAWDKNDIVQSEQDVLDSFKFIEKTSQ